VLFHLFYMIRIVPPAEKPAVDLGMQGLHPAVEHLGKSRELGHVLHLDPAVTKELGRPSGRKKLHAELLKLPGEIENAVLV